MRIRTIALIASTLFAAPAFAGDVEIYQVGRSNWAAANQSNASNYVQMHQFNTSVNGNNYASFAQTGRRNEFNTAQSSYTDNVLGVTQTGRDNYGTVFQSAEGVNTFSLTQTRLRRR